VCFVTILSLKDDLMGERRKGYLNYLRPRPLNDVRLLDTVGIYSYRPYSGHQYFDLKSDRIVVYNHTFDVLSVLERVLYHGGTMGYVRNISLPVKV